MADIFVDDGGSATAPYETWAKAATTFLVGVDAAAAGDRIIIGHDHTENPGGNVVYTFPGTLASPNVVISATSTAGGSVITYNKADNIQVDNGASIRDITITGVVYFYGVSFRAGDDFISTSAGSYIYYDDSLLELNSAGARYRIGGSNGQNEHRLRNTDVNFSGGDAGTAFAVEDSGLFIWEGGTLSYTGTQPTSLFQPQDENPYIQLAGVDLSAITTALFIISNACDAKIEMHTCLLNSGVALTTGTMLGGGTTILNSGSDDSTGNDLYRLDYIDYWGSTVHDDAIYRDSGATDGDNNISWKMVTTANAAEFTEPTKSPPIYVWVDAVGSTTFTVSILSDTGATDLQDDEVWLEIEYLEASADTDSAFANDRMADITATPADQTNNSETWTENLANENEQEVAVTVTVNRVGFCIGRVCLAKPSTTIYADPVMVKS